MSEEITIKKFVRAIEKLPWDKPKIRQGVWYTTQKQHWLGWLKYYHGPGAYNRKVGQNRDAKFAYNHVVNYQMLTWIIDAAGVDPKLVKKAKSIIDNKKTLQANAGAVRKIVPWEKLADALWSNT